MVSGSTMPDGVAAGPSIRRMTTLSPSGTTFTGIKLLDAAGLLNLCPQTAKSLAIHLDSYLQVNHVQVRPRRKPRI